MQKNLNINVSVVGVIVLAILLIGGLSYWIWYDANQPGQYDTLAQCIASSGAKFYGAFWCPHCQNQKAIFGKSAKYLPYIECSTPDGRGQLQVCIDKGVVTYPTWYFPDNSSSTGEIPLTTLAEKTSCALSQ